MPTENPIVVTTSGPIQAGLAGKTILQVIQEACPSIGLSVPSAVFTSTAREHVELRALASEMAERIAVDTADWTKLKLLATINGDGATTAFDLPEDYGRMLKTARVWPSSMTTCPLNHIADTDEWLAMDLSAVQWIYGAWTMIGEQINIKPAIASGATASFYYLSRQFAMSNTGDLKTTFTADDDFFRLDNRLLRLGIIWQWKANKGFPYAEDMTTYEDALANRIGADKGSNIIGSGSKRFNADVGPAYPWPLG
jgi:hypothetical protein